MMMMMNKKMERRKKMTRVGIPGEKEVEEEGDQGEGAVAQVMKRRMEKRERLAKRPVMRRPLRNSFPSTFLTILGQSWSKTFTT